MKKDTIQYRFIVGGIDTLEIGYSISHYHLTQEEWELIAEAKETAQATLHEKGTGIKFRGKDFMVLRAGSSRYKYILSNDDVQIRIFSDARAGSNFPEIRIKFNSSFLWRKGWKEAALIADKWLRSWADVTEIKISRLDVMADYSGKLKSLSPDMKEVVTRSKKKKEHGTYERYAEGKQQTGYSFGAGQVLCRIYDKTKEILKSEKQWFEAIWQKNGWKENELVTRVEFQCRRKFLREFQVDTLDDLFVQVADIWRYLTSEWLTIREVKVRTSRTRWPINPFWKLVQETTNFFGPITGVTRLKQVKPKYDHLEKQLNGLMKSMAAIASRSLGNGEIKYGKKAVQASIKKCLNDEDFDYEVEKRISRYGVMEY